MSLLENTKNETIFAKMFCHRESSWRNYKWSSSDFFAVVEGSLSKSDTE